MWAWDSSLPDRVGDQIVGITQLGGGPEIVFTDAFAPSPTEPFVFFVENYNLPNAFGIFTRENNGTGDLVLDDYTFNGADVPPSPADNGVYSFSFYALADAEGQMLITGRSATDFSHGVFLNAIRLELIPEPGTLILAALGLLGLAWYGRRRFAR